MSLIEGSPGSDQSTLLEIFMDTARKHPNAKAIESDHSSLTYRQLSRIARRIATKLNRRGIGAGDRVSIQVETGSARLYESVLGVIFSGAAYVPIDHADSESRTETIKETAKVSAHITNAGIEFLIRAGKRKSAPRPSDDAWVIFTSGSTGKPKAVAVAHSSAANLVQAERGLFCQSQPLGPNDRVAASLSPAFDASVEEMWLAWASGATLVLLKRETLMSGPDLAKELRSRKISAFSTVPSIARYLADQDLAELRLLILGGEAVSETLVAALAKPHLELWNTYGPTEATVIATATLLAPDRPISIGFPLQGVTVAVVNANDDLVPLGEIGELVIAGVGLGRYLDDSLDSERFRGIPRLGFGRCYRTGDQVRVTPAGHEFVGRIDDQVKVAGKRIELLEIEQVALSTSGVIESAAVARKTESGDSEVHCFVVVATEFEAERLQNTFRENIAAGVEPIIHEVNSFPLRSSGKVDKALLLAAVDEQLSIVRGNNFIEQQFRRVLGGAAVTPNSNFFKCGGTSARAAQLVMYLRARYESVTVLDIYKFSTPLELEVELEKRTRVPQTEAPVDSRSSLPGWPKSLLAIAVHLAVGMALGVVLTTFRGVDEESFFSIATICVLVLCLMAGAGRAVAAGLIVRLLTFDIKPGTYRRNGFIHLKIWLAERLVDLFNLVELSGTPWMSIYATLTGSKISKSCSIESLPPVLGNLSLGENSSIGRDVHMAGWNLRGKQLIVDGFEIGSNVRIGNRTFLCEGVEISSNCEVETGTLVNRNLEDGYYSGSPIQQGQKNYWPQGQAVGSASWRAAFAFAPTLLAVGTALQFLFPLIIFEVQGGSTNLDSYGYFLVTWSWILAPGAQIMGALFTAMQIRIASAQIQTGFSPAFGKVGFASWVVERSIAKSRRQYFWLYASIITPLWLRLLGAQVSRGGEISTLNGQVGNWIIGASSFIADDASIAPRELKGGWLKIQGTSLGRRVFVGNSAHIASGTDVEDGVLIGVASSVPRAMLANSSFLGLPPLEFPRQARSGSQERTFSPTLGLKARRSIIEIFRLMPSILNLALTGMLVALVFAPRWTGVNESGLFTAIIFALSYVLASYSAVAAVVIAKWTLVGRVKKSEHELWSGFVWRNELVWNFVESTLIPWVGWILTETQIQNLIFRMMGAKVGRNVSISTWYLDDPDLISIGDNTVIMKSADIQTHLFHDRIMQLDQVTIESNCSVGSGSFLLPGSTLQHGCSVAAGSLLPRGETTPRNSNLLGNPVSVVAWS